MKIAALQISVGDYTAKTGVIQKDEIGELASAMDDMSDKLEAAAQEQMKLDKLRRDFIANISHELRTPVTVIRGSLEAICNGVVSDAGKVTEYHNQMLSEAILQTALRENKSGTGLGLAIAKQIAERHLAAIKLKSETGRGTEFTFLFPCL
jgi:signal transduction histidine kinase